MFKFKELIYLPEENRNKLRSFRQYVDNQNLADCRYASSKCFYPYNLDINDAGWGCAWRCIQMLLTQHNIAFQELFDSFGDRSTLLSLYSKLRPYDAKGRAALQHKKFAPHDLSNGWAEPFIGLLILSHYKVSSELVLLNSYPLNANAPKEVFTNTIGFEQFRHLIINHFDAGRGLIMIDDATYTMVIFGYRTDPSSNLCLLIGDPHISNNRTHELTGIYQVFFDSSGKQLKNTLTEEEKSSMQYASYNSLQFVSTPWMVLFADF